MSEESGATGATGMTGATGPAGASGANGASRATGATGVTQCNSNSKELVVPGKDKVSNVNEQFLCDMSPPYKCKWTDFKRPGVFGVAKWLYEGSRATIPKEEELDRELPIIKTLNFKGSGSEKTGNDVRVTWLGHACVLVQIGDMKILTDPVFSIKCGPKFKYQIGHKRYREAPCTIYELSKMVQIDAVVISHNHYDHLDYESVCQLAAHFPNLEWFVPLGVKAFMESCKCKNVKECSWWKDHELRGVQFTFVPAQHWSKRGLMDDNMTLWGGWCVKGPKGNFYFAGDTGYDDKLFKEIGAKLGPFDLAAIPIGAYCPRWFMSRHHIDPEEALKIHEDVKAKKSIGIHWGTFNLSSEPILEPRNRIIELQIRKNIEELRKEKIEELHIKNIEVWLNELIKELPKETFGEWLKKKMGELNVEEFEELWREIEEWLSNRIEKMWKKKIKEWLRKKIGELHIEEIQEKQIFEKWLNKVEELHKKNIESLQKEKPEEGKKMIEEWLKNFIKELKEVRIDQSQNERLEEWLKKNTDELLKEKTEESQESLEERLRNKIAELQKEEIEKKLNFEKWLNKIEKLHKENVENLQKENPEERKKIDECLKEKIEKLWGEKIVEWLRKNIKELKIDQIDKSQKERLEKWLENRPIEELHKEKTDKSQESLEEWLRKKIEEMQKEKVEEWLREKTDEVLHSEEVEDLQRDISGWLGEKMEELRTKKLTNLQTGFDFFTISIGETKFIKSEK